MPALHLIIASWHLQVQHVSCFDTSFFTVVFVVVDLVVVVSDACGGSGAVFAFALPFQSCLNIFGLHRALSSTQPRHCFALLLLLFMF